jgi:hypothetical protein
VAAFWGETSAMQLKKLGGLWYSMKNRFTLSMTSYGKQSITLTDSETPLGVSAALVEQVPIYREVRNGYETLGLITNVKPVENGVEITGCVASFDGYPIDDFVVYLRGKPLLIIQCAKDLPAPDFEREFPNLKLASHGGFILNIALPPGDLQRDDEHVFFICPIIKHAPGGTLVGMYPPHKVDLPSEEDAHFVGGGDFYFVGLHIFAHLIKYAGLKPTDHILDVGCGIGRIAYPLSRYCSREARYEGFDVWEAGIEWARNHIASRRPNFNFQKVDLFNKLYNPSGQLSASDFTFPYEDQSFDVVFLSSVFTHMNAEEVRGYPKEIHRVLKPEG